MDIPGNKLELRVGIDIGGTFTDFVVYRPASGSIDSFKLPSTPHNPAAAVIEGLHQLSKSIAPLPPSAHLHVVHGSTVATNALLERKGARTALITTRGFRDVLQIGRQHRPALYDLTAAPHPPLVVEEYRLEVSERLDKHGNVLIPLDIDEVKGLVSRLVSEKIESVAVSLLFSFTNPRHERAISACFPEASNSPGSGEPVSLSLSSQILPEYREYERTSTTVINAYVTPVLDRYLSLLEQEVSGAQHGPGRAELHLRIMQSNGGQLSLSEARKNGVRCILSGPAGGIIGARYIAENALGPDRGDQPAQARSRVAKVITFDMGGTSTDVSLIDGEPGVTTEALVAGMPVSIPLLDIHTIGAGGGSIARLDLGGALRVGPHSAGADPGPACYGRGDLPTVTDANLVLGRLAPDYFLGGKIRLDVPRAEGALARLGAAIGRDPAATALGVIEVANAHMERALRVISVERGYDPSDFTLLSFGGAGGLHAADLARRLAVPQVLIPPMAATLSAFGMLAADVVKDYSQTVMLPGETEPGDLSKRLEALAGPGVRHVLGEGVRREHIVVEPALDMRYLGQSYELTVPFGTDFRASFHRAHEKTYGFSRPEADLEIVNLRVRVTGKIAPPLLPISEPAGSDPSAAYQGHRPLMLAYGTGFSDVPVFRGEDLRPGNQIAGPALILRADTTILIGKDDSVSVDAGRNLVLKIG